MSGSPRPRTLAAWWRTPRLLDALSASAVLAALALSVWPTAHVPPAGDVVLPPPGLLRAGTTERGVLQVSAGLDTTAQAIVAGNLFSASRRAPTARFTPPGLAAADAGTEVPTAMPGMSPSSGGNGAFGAAVDDGAARDAQSERVPQLFGIVIMDGERRALLQLRAGAPPQLYEAGGSAFGFRIIRIDSALVVLRSSAGTQTLRLRRPSRDSSSRLP